MSTVVSSRSSSSIQLRRLFWLGPLTVFLSILGVLMVRVLAVVILHPRPLPMSLRWSTPAVFTFVLVTGAVIVFAITAAAARSRAIRIFQIVAVVVLLLSLIPDAMYATSRMPGASWPVAIFLMIMHVVAAGITVVMLTKLSVVE